MKAAWASRGSFNRATERPQADTSLADVLMTVELRSPRGFGIIAMPHAHILQPHGFVQVLQCILQSLRAHNVVTRDMSVAGIDAGANRNQLAQVLQHFRDLFEAAAERVFRARLCFRSGWSGRLGQVESLRGRGNGGRRPHQPLLPVGSAKRSWMQHQILRAQS